jgi:WD40 repeat protein
MTHGMDDVSPDAFTVRLLTSAGTPAGVGVLVTHQHIVTCAHVVNGALGRDLAAQDVPPGIVTVDFPLISREPLRARVVCWVPPPKAGLLAGDDVAGLELIEGRSPTGAVPAQLMVEQSRPGRIVRVYGCPAGRPDGQWVDATIRERVANGRFQLDSDPGQRIRQGFSGSPVVDATGRVTGLVSLVPSRAQEADSYAVTAAQLRLLWPGVLNPKEPTHSELTVVHLCGLRFGSGASPDAVTRLADDVTSLADVRPSLLVVTGDLTEHGRPKECQGAFDLLGELAETAGIPRRHVAIVPGRRDVNHALCRNYFTEREEQEEQPVWPYYPKWRFFAEALAGFYDDAELFTPDEPWTLFEMPELSVVVAGLNSTMGQTHEHDVPEAGDKQLRWFGDRMAEYRRRRWLRLAAIHDARTRAVDERLGGVNLLLRHGPLDTGPPALAVPDVAAGFYQLLVVRRDSVTRQARRYSTDHWTGDTELGTTWRYVSRDADATLPGPGYEPDERPPRPLDPGGSGTIFDLVVEATRARWPDATITQRPDEGYLRVTRPLPGGGTQQHVIGVTDEVGTFIDGVHAAYQAADPMTRSEYVYTGPSMSASAAVQAGQSGVSVRRFSDYQRLLNLDGIVQRQQAQLAEDPLYPERLYIEQRYRPVDRTGRPGEVRTGLVRQAVEWLGEDGPRLMLVLGDFGRGKTAFLKQLARTLPVELSGLVPIFIELRGLEKAPTIDQLLVQYLAQHVDDISLPKLDYMIRSGRVVLLFDGFDELELRVGYDSAADYLTKLLGSVTEQAKVVFTSRTQHFLSTDQVTTAFGARVTARVASRVTVLEDFTESQIIQFLTGLYDGDPDRARARVELLAATANLLELARNPRMLTFVAAMDEERLSTLSGTVSGADLYREIVGYWLGYETERGSRSITADARFAACRALALRMWTSAEDAIGLDELTAEVSGPLRDLGLAERGYSAARMAHAIGSGSLLVHGEDGGFRFVHRSIMEWFVADAAAADLKARGTSGLLEVRGFSEVMTGFLADLAGRDATVWSSQIAADERAAATTRQNAARLTGWLLKQLAPVATLQVPATLLNLAGTDLRDQDLNGRDLHGANLHGANLRGMRLRDVDLSHTDLTGADLREVRMTGGSLAGAQLTGSRWDRAALLAVTYTIPRPPELDAAAITGRDPAEVMLRASGAGAQCVAFSADPELPLLAIGWGNTIEIIDPRDSTVLRVLHGHTESVTGVAFSPDGTQLATASYGRAVRLWDTTTGTTRTTLTGHTDWVTAVAFSPDGTVLATASRDHTTRLWDTATGITRTTLTADRNAVTAVAFSPDGTQLATASYDRTARLWDTTTGTTRTILNEHTSWVNAIAFSPDGTQLATASHDGTARLWDTTTGTTRTTLTGHYDYVSAVAFSPDGTQLATASHDGTARLWDTTTGTTRTTLTGHDSTVTAIAFSPDGTRLATASDDHTARLWDATTGTALLTLTGHGRTVTAVEFSPDGTRLATAAHDRTARLWDITVPTNRAVRTIRNIRGRNSRVTLTGHGSIVTAVAFSPDGTQLATASGDGTARLWDTTTGTTQAILTGHDSPVTSVAFSPDGTLLATAARDGTARLWETTDGTTQAILTGHSSYVSAVAFSPDGTQLATASRDGTARIWDVHAGSLVATLVSLPDNAYVTLLPDGSYKLQGAPGDRVWWAIKLCGFEAGELDPHIRNITRLHAQAPIPGLKPHP